MPRWEYKVVQSKVLVGVGGSETSSDREREELLNRYGKDGWELVSVSVQSYRRDYDPTALQGYSFFSYFFKKQLP
jgi:Domain of unknown function (DUF4177)